MALDLRLFSDKLRRYRLQLQVEIPELAAATGIPADSLAAFEGGTLEPTGDQVLILADYFKCDYRFFISNQRLAPFEQTEQLFRAHGNSFSKDDRKAIQEFLFLCECEEFLFQSLPGYIRRHAFTFTKVGSFFKDHGVQAAATLRRHFKYSANEVPQDIYQDFRSLGYHVFRRRLGNSNISGLFIKHPVAGQCILVNYSEDPYRQRFTAAHEAAHAILDGDQDFVVSYTKWNRKDLSEIRANAFASHYLLPPDFLRAIPESGHWDGTKIVDWAKRLKVSTSALVYGLSEAGLLSAQAANTFGQLRIPPQDKVDPELPPGLPPQSRARRETWLQRGLSYSYVRLCFDAYHQGAISAGRLAEALLVDFHELPTLATEYGRDLSYDG